MSKQQAARIRACRDNIDRYCRLLATELTELERDYVHRRIAQQHAELARLQAESLARMQGEAHPDTVIAAAAMARNGDGHSRQ